MFNNTKEWSLLEKKAIYFRRHWQTELKSPEGSSNIEFLLFKANSRMWENWNISHSFCSVQVSPNKLFGQPLWTLWDEYGSLYYYYFDVISNIPKWGQKAHGAAAKISQRCRTLQLLDENKHLQLFTFHCHALSWDSSQYMTGYRWDDLRWFSAGPGIFLITNMQTSSGAFYLLDTWG